MEARPVLLLLLRVVLLLVMCCCYGLGLAVLLLLLLLLAVHLRDAHCLPSRLCHGLRPHLLQAFVRGGGGCCRNRIRFVNKAFRVRSFRLAIGNKPGKMTLCAQWALYLLGPPSPPSSLFWCPTHTPRLRVPEKTNDICSLNFKTYFFFCDSGPGDGSQES